MAWALSAPCILATWLATVDANAAWYSTRSPAGWDPTAVAIWQNTLVALNWNDNTGGPGNGGTVYGYYPGPAVWKPIPSPGVAVVSFAVAEWGPLYLVGSDGYIYFLLNPSSTGAVRVLGSTTTCTGGTFQARTTPVTQLAARPSKTIAVGQSGAPGGAQIYVQGADYHIYWYDFSGTQCWYQMPALPGGQTPVDLAIWDDPWHTSPDYPWPWVVDTNQNMWQWIGSGGYWAPISRSQGISLGVNNIGQVIGADNTTVWDDNNGIFSQDTTWNSGYVYSIGTVTPGYTSYRSALIQYDLVESFTVYYQQ
jgi:hypothetical protein